ncbi:helix-hairpin-helix domain-containing protein [Candidatus Pacearchaeota archaeon]|nr:helix-hairpin-helix domain-containing protein [Candidatus Pacearchaeota archaeon]
MKYLFGILIVLMLTNILAVCESGQIDVNSASLEKLDELSGIGPVKAQAIIDTRPFDSVDDLINVYGIGPVTLQKIKDQGLACVDGEGEKKDAEEDEEKVSVEEVGTLKGISEKETESLIISSGDIQSKKNPELKTIKLSALDTKDIKSEDDKKNLDKSDWAKYGFIGFCVLLGFLFILKKRKVRSEFD